jgi:hypothetical protein
MTVKGRSALVTAYRLAHGFLERGDLRVSSVVSDWYLEDSAAYPAVWSVTQPSPTSSLTGSRSSSQNAAGSWKSTGPSLAWMSVHADECLMREE